MKKYIFLIVLLFMLASLAQASEKINLEAALKIALNDANSLGYEPMEMNAQITKHHKPWNWLLPKDSTAEYVLERQRLLEKKTYWAVYLTPRSLEDTITPGGDVCIFIDANTGAIITRYRGK